MQGGGRQLHSVQPSPGSAGQRKAVAPYIACQVLPVFAGKAWHPCPSTLARFLSPSSSPRPQRAKQAGDFLLVGVHTDEDVTERRGRHLPIMNLHERALSVLSCRWVDEVVIGGWVIAAEAGRQAGSWRVFAAGAGHLPSTPAVQRYWRPL